MEDYSVSEDAQKVLKPSREPPATFDNKAVFEMFTSIRDDHKETRKKLDEIGEKLVGLDRYQAAKDEANDRKFEDICERLKPLEVTCNSFESVRKLIPSTADVLQVKSDALKDAREEDKSITSRLDTLDNKLGALDKKLAFLDLAWWSSCHVKNFFGYVYRSNNRIVQGIFVLAALGYIQLNLDTILIIVGKAHDFLNWP
jgi:hypothetical protein